MTMSAIGSNDFLASSLKAQGLSADKIQLVENDLQQAANDNAASGGGAPTSVDGATVRVALDKKISDDVASGKLSREDADKIGKALDQVDGTAQNGAAASHGAGGSRPAGGGGGGAGADGSAEKTELSRTVTVSGGIKTTVITYTDGTTETETSVDVTDPDTSPGNKTGDAAKAEGNSKSAAQQAPGTADDKTVQAYLSTIEPGSLVDTYA